MSKKPTLTEEDIASIGQLYLDSKGWDCYPEVVIPIFGGRPDIVATKGNKLCLVAEAKKNLSYPVIEQLTRWHMEHKKACESDYQDESLKAIPSLMVAIVNSVPTISDLKADILDRYRIGVWLVSHSLDSKPISPYGEGVVHFNNEAWAVTEILPAKIQLGSRGSAEKIISHLNPDMKVGKAGASGKHGAYMTPFKRTMNTAWQLLKTLEPGTKIHIDKIVEYINSNGGHHYANDGNAKRGIKSALERDGHTIEWCRLIIPDYKSN